ncbi:MAG: hypothetical protein HC906_15310 [Bacteroidales bacterium]|nr:hypothetical protein [Bacteroidales bacterium]
MNNLKKDQEMIENYKNMKKVDVDKAWNNVLGRIQVSQLQWRTNQLFIKTKNQLYLYLQVAAGIALIAGLFFLYQFINRNDRQICICIEPEEVILPDGSKVLLNGGSKIKYPDVFDENTREVILYGEAFLMLFPMKTNHLLLKLANRWLKY